LDTAFKKTLEKPGLYPEEVTMNLLTITVMTVLIYGMTLSPWAGAESQLNLPSELSGTHQIMKILGSVNLMRSEQNTNPSLQDVLETKNQLYKQESLLAPVSTTSSLSGKSRYGYSVKGQPERLRMPNHR
jgi:hypothetical protein